MERVKIAIDKESNIYPVLLEFLTRCDISFVQRNFNHKLVCKNFPIEFVFVSSWDIPDFVNKSLVDAGIVGEHIYVESQKILKIRIELNSDAHHLCISGQQSEMYSDMLDLVEKRIATPYPNILKRFLQEQNIRSHIIHTSESVLKVDPSIDLADAICDLVDSVSLSSERGYVELCKLNDFADVIITKENLQPIKNQIIDDLCMRLKSVLNSDGNKYIILNAPSNTLHEISLILSGLRSPTYTHLHEPGWISVQAVISEDEFWDNIEKLKSIGAKDILVMPIQKLF